MTKNFEIIATLQDNNIDLCHAALLIAKDEYPQLDVAGYIRQLNSYATQIAQRLSPGASAKDMLSQLNHYLFNDLGFTGDKDNYYDPRNSYLNEVLDRKRGIPITLSIIYIEIGKRLGLDLQGISFPGHFLVRLNVNNGAIILDPYYGGISLSEDELVSRVSDISQETSLFLLEDLLKPASNRAIIERILRNLRGAYLQDQQHEKALRSADRMVFLAPNNPEEYLIRGAIYKELECFTPALQDYRRYLQMDPEAYKDDAIRADIIQLQQAVNQLH